MELSTLGDRINATGKIFIQQLFRIHGMNESCEWKRIRVTRTSDSFTVSYLYTVQDLSDEATIAIVALPTFFLVDLSQFIHGFIGQGHILFRCHESGYIAEFIGRVVFELDLEGYAGLHPRISFQELLIVPSYTSSVTE